MRKIIFILALLCCSYSAKSQDITGKVIDTDGNPMIGASVYWADTNVGVAADMEGKFRLHRVKDYNNLVGSFLGYTNDTIKVDNSTTEIVLHLSQGVAVESVVVEGNSGNYNRQDGILKGETISFAGLCKMACCNLAESFENSASVTVGYSDAISGARQIKMLGLAGTYTQILDENRTIMRGLSAPYGLSYTPGMWLSSIQVSKGISSVTAGHEAITGQINLEHRKPTDQERLFINLYFNNELRPEVNLSSALPVTKDKKLTTVTLFHGSADTKSFDHNHDHFRDMPLSRQFDVASRWLYQAGNGAQIRWGAKYVNDYRLGGHKDYKARDYDKMLEDWKINGEKATIYGSEVENQEVNAYFKIGCPVGKAVFSKDENDEMRSNVAMVVDYDYFREKNYFGAVKDYLGTQNEVNLNLMYVHYFTYRSSLISGINASSRWVNENLIDRLQNDPFNFNRNESELGAYTEYTYALKDKFSVVAGFRYDYNFHFNQNLITPRAHIKWNITKTTILRGSVGMGYRPTDIVTDNIGIMATGRKIIFEGNKVGSTIAYNDMNRMEKALTVGGSISQYISTIAPNDMTISFDFFRTNLYHSVIVDQERDAQNIFCYESNRPSYTNTYQVDLTWSPVQRLDIFATFRWTDSHYTIRRGDGTYQGIERPLTSSFKTLLNIQYATNMRKWIFDATAQLNGRSRIPTQTGVLADSHHSPVYPIFYAQISRRIRHWDIYVGCENIGNYKLSADEAIMNYQTPYASNFNASCVWGPLMGRKFYIGIRFNLY